MKTYKNLILFFSLLILTLTSHRCGQLFLVTSPSMSPTLLPGDRIFVRRPANHSFHPHRGELVLLKTPQDKKIIIRKVIGLPEEVLTFQDGDLLIDGHAYMSSPYFSEKLRVPVPPRSYFVLSENLSAGEDSRTFGPLPKKQILGTPVFILFSTTGLGKFTISLRKDRLWSPLSHLSLH